MTISIILGHPYEKSFNHAIYKTIINVLKKNKHKIYAHDLYKENFNPLLACNELGEDVSTDPLVIKYSKELIESNGIIFIHPNWWGQPPAVIKGYIDRVFRQPYAYEFDEGDKGGGVPAGKLNDKTALVFNTSNTEEKRENSVFGDPLEKIWKNCIFEFCGIKKYYRKMYRIISDSSDTQRKGWLKEIEETVKYYFKGSSKNVVF